MATGSGTTVEVRRAVVVSYRLGGADGVSTEAAKWAGSLRHLGCSVSTLAGEGEADVLELAQYGIAAVTMRNAFEADPPPGDRERARRALGIAGTDLLVVQPTRAIPRKNVAGALALAEALGGAYWLVGPAEEGFGNPSIEAGLHHRLVAVGHYPAAEELRGLGFRWLDPQRPWDIEPHLSGWRGRGGDTGTEGGCDDIVAHNAALARRLLNLDDLPGRLARLLAGMGLRAPAVA